MKMKKTDRIFYYDNAKCYFINEKEIDILKDSIIPKTNYEKTSQNLEEHVINGRVAIIDNEYKILENVIFLFFHKFQNLKLNNNKLSLYYSCSSSVLAIL